MAGLHDPLPTLRRYPRGCRRTARGRCGSLFLHRSGLSPPTPCQSPGALPRFLVLSILTRLRRARVIGSDETTVRVGGRTHWNWVFQNEQLVIHVIRPTRGRAVVDEVLGGHRPRIWVSDLYGAQRGHGDTWQVCLAHQLRDLRYAIEAGDTIFAPRLKALLLRAVLLARRRHALKDSTRREYRL